MDLCIQPSNSFEDLVEIFGAERVRCCLSMALGVALTGQGIGTYLAEVSGESIEYDGMMPPGVTSCICDNFTVRHFCDHVTAIAVIVFRRGSMSDEAELDSGLDSLSPVEIINLLPVQDLRGILLLQLGATIPLDITLRLREQAEQFLAVPYGSDDTERFTPIRGVTKIFDQFVGNSNTLIVDVKNFINVVTPFLQAGYGPRLVQPVIEAASKVRKLIQKIGPSERLYSIWDSVVSVAKTCSVPADEQLVGWVEETLGNEKTDQEFLTLDKIFSLLSDNQLREFVDWLYEQNDARIETWERTVSVSEKLSLDDVYSYQMLHVPRAAWSSTVDRVLHKSPTTERVMYIRSFFEQGLFAFGRSSETTYAAKSVLEWLVESSSPEANGLYNDIVLTLFDPRHPQESLEAAAAVGPMTATDKEKYLAQAEEILSAEQFRLFQVILKTFRLEVRRDSVLVSRGDAAMLDCNQSWLTFEKLRHSFPLTTINLGLGSVGCEYRLFPSYHHQAIVDRLLEVETEARLVGRIEMFDEFLNEFAAITYSDERVASALQGASLIPRTDEGADQSFN